MSLEAADTYWSLDHGFMTSLPFTPICALSSSLCGHWPTIGVRLTHNPLFSWNWSFAVGSKPFIISLLDLIKTWAKSYQGRASGWGIPLGMCLLGVINPLVMTLYIKMTMKMSHVSWWLISRVSYVLIYYQTFYWHTIKLLLSLKMWRITEEEIWLWVQGVYHTENFLSIQPT